MRRVLKFAEHHGWSELLRRLRISSFGRLHDRRTVLIQLLQPQTAADVDPEIEVRELSEADSEIMLETMYLNSDVLQRRFRRGDRSFAVLEEGRIASYGWTTSGTHHLSEAYLSFRCAPGQAWFYNGVTVKDARGRGYYTAVLLNIAAILRREGYSALYVHVEAANTPSRAGLKRAGFSTILTLQVHKLMSRRRYMLTVQDPAEWSRVRPTILDLPSEEFVTVRLANEIERSSHRRPSD